MGAGFGTQCAAVLERLHFNTVLYGELVDSGKGV